MESVRCDICEAAFAIVHPVISRDALRARSQTTEILSILLGDHVNPRFRGHSKDMNSIQSSQLSVEK